jgi:hypothetical protein
LVEALGFTLGCAVPAFIAQLVLKQRRAYHVWTVAIALLLAFGTYYANSR